MSRFLILLFIVFQTPLLQASWLERCSAIFDTKMEKQIENSRMEVIKILIENGVNLNRMVTNERTVLMWAAEHGHLKIVERLIKEGADVDVKNGSGYTALMYAVINRHLKIVERLIKEGADVYTRDYIRNNTALEYAMKMGDVEMIKILIDAGARRKK